MTRSSILFIRYSAIILLGITLLSACEPDIYGTSNRRANTPTQTSAAEYARQGNHNAAARAYRKLADKSTGVQRDKYLLEAAQQWYEINRFKQAQGNLAAIRSLLDAQSQVRKILLQTSVLLELQQPSQALTSINTLDPQNSADIARPYYGLKARALFALGELSEGTEQFVLRERYTRNLEELQDNRKRLWMELTDRINQGFKAESVDDDELVAGWISLAKAVNSVPSVRLQKRIIDKWAEEYPEHPARTTALDNLQSNDEYLNADGVAPLGEINSVGVLLPLSGRLAKAGQIIKQGIEASNRRLTQPVQLSFYDTNLGALNAYRNATLNEVDALIGPLSKDNILEISGRLGDKPALVLNRIDQTLGMSGLLQFGLAPEDEAINAAQFALARGYTQALTLTPSNEWGQRVLQHFTMAFTAGGGTVLEDAIYSTRENDHSTAITGMLNLDESKQRFQRVRYLLGEEIEYDPRRRKDVDFIFLAAQAQQGRLIRPQLKFHYASHIPVFATSDIFNADPIRNKDLNGIQLPLSAWVADPLNTDALLADELNITEETSASSQLLQLFSLGYDSLQYLLHLGLDTVTPYQGLSGELSIDSYGVVHRNLPLSSISGGKIQFTQDRLLDIQFVYDYYDYSQDMDSETDNDPLDELDTIVE